MTKIIEHTSNGFKWLLVEVPEDGNTFDIKYSHLAYYQGEPSFGAIRTIMLPSGSWEIVDKADSLTEVQWKEIVDTDVFFDIDDADIIDLAGGVYEGDDCFKNYEPSHNKCWSADDSGLSLLRSHGLKPETTLILKSTQLL